MYRLALVLLLALPWPAFGGEFVILGSEGQNRLEVQFEAHRRDGFAGLWTTYRGDFDYQDRFASLYFQPCMPRHWSNLCACYYFTGKPSGPAHVACSVDVLGRVYFQFVDPFDESDVKIITIGGWK